MTASCEDSSELEFFLSWLCRTGGQRHAEAWPIACLLTCMPAGGSEAGTGRTQLFDLSACELHRDPVMSRGHPTSIVKLLPLNGHTANT
jgi:hypothetical protein